MISTARGGNQRKTVAYGEECGDRDRDEDVTHSNLVGVDGSLTKLRGQGTDDSDVRADLVDDRGGVLALDNLGELALKASQGLKQQKGGRGENKRSDEP